MLKVKFANGTEFEYLSAIETEEYYSGASRRTLTFNCDIDVISLDALNSLLSVEDNCETIILTNDDLGVVNVYDKYVLKLKVGIEPVIIEPETPDSPTRYSDQIIFKLGKRTYIEQALHDLGIN